MTRVIDKSHFFSIERVLFPDEPITNSKCDLIRYMRFPVKRTDFSTAIENTAYTYWTDLQVEEADILSKFSKSIRYEIRKSENDSIRITFYDKDCIKNMRFILHDFKNSYMHFCDLCNNDDLKRVYDEKLIETYIENDCFLLTRAEYESGGIYHAYFYSDDNACLWYSVSDFRRPVVDRNLAARANKRLHIEDMKYFKRNGIKYYDWGNISSRYNAHPNGIDRFKESFGGAYTEVFSYTVGNTFLGRILVKASNVFKH